MSKKIVLAGACRTAIGTMGGSLSTTPAAKLGSIVIGEALKRAGVSLRIRLIRFIWDALSRQDSDRMWHVRHHSGAGLPIETPAVTRQRSMRIRS